MVDFYDFGIGHVPISGDDVLFLDSNFIIAYLMENHNFHLPCANFLLYIYAVKEVSLTISEITVSEVMFALARSYYAQDETIAFRSINGREPNGQEKVNINRDWNRIIKNDRNRHKHYNTIASGIFKPFLDHVHFLPASEKQVRDAIDLMENVPMASSDALLSSCAINNNCSGIISIDCDFQDIPQISKVYTTSVQNNAYNLEPMMKTLGTKQVWIESLGKEGFINKFGFSPL